MHEARIEESDAGLVPADDGWFILNVADIAWERCDGVGTWCSFESPSARSKTLGIGVHVLPPGEAPGFYHLEGEQEGFLVLEGECVAIVEGEERRMRRWDYLHSPPGTRHITIGAGEEPCAILMVGTRKEPDEVLYPASEVAGRHGAAVERETPDPKVAYATRKTRRAPLGNVPW